MQATQSAAPRTSESFAWDGLDAMSNVAFTVSSNSRLSGGQHGGTTEKGCDLAGASARDKRES
jgi:hypothetical protein